MNKIYRMSELPESERLYPIPPEEVSSLGEEGVSPDDPSGSSLGHQTRAAKSRLLGRLLGPGCEEVPYRRGDGTVVPVYFIRQGG